MVPGEVVCRGEAQSQNGGHFISLYGPGMMTMVRFLRSTKIITYSMFFLLFTLRIASKVVPVLSPFHNAHVSTFFRKEGKRY